MNISQDQDHMLLRIQKTQDPNWLAGFTSGEVSAAIGLVVRWRPGLDYVTAVVRSVPARTFSPTTVVAWPIQ